MVRISVKIIEKLGNDFTGNNSVSNIANGNNTIQRVIEVSEENFSLEMLVQNFIVKELLISNAYILDKILKNKTENSVNPIHNYWTPEEEMFFASLEARPSNYPEVVRICRLAFRESKNLKEVFVVENGSQVSICLK